MRKIRNVHLNDDPERYQCIGCSPFNPIGLKLEFWDDGEGLVCEWEPRPEFVGWENILHGGIQATLLDEIAAWVVYVKCETAGVTSSMTVDYKKPIFTNKGNLILKGKLIETERRFAIIKAEIYNSEGVLCSEAEVKYFIYPEKIAREKFHYPGIGAFYEE